MGEVVRLRRPRNKTIKGHARACLTEALRSSGKPVAVVVVVLGSDGKFALRTASDQQAIQDFDMYSRAGALCDKERLRLVDDE